MKHNIVTVAIAGLLIGKIIDQNIRKTLAPSIIADSSISIGNALIKLYNKKMVIGRLNAIYGNIKASLVFKSPKFCMNKNMGTNVACTGTNKPKIKKPYISARSEEHTSELQS